MTETKKQVYFISLSGNQITLVFKYMRIYCILGLKNKPT